MSTASFDDPSLRAAMLAYLEAAAALDDVADTATAPQGARNVLDLAEAKTLAGMLLRRRLLEAGWQAPAPARRATAPAPTA